MTATSMSVRPADDVHAAPVHGDPMTGPDGLVASVAAHGLPGAVRSLPQEPLSDETWATFMRGVRFQRVSGHLVHALADGVFPATPQQENEAVGLHTDAMRQVLCLERLLIDTVELLTRAGVRAVALKGSALAHTAYPSPALRVFGDVDLLVPSESFDDAAAVLTDLGLQRRWPQLRAGFDRRFGKSATLVHPDGYEIDLHRTFALGPFGLTVDLPALFDTATSFEVGGRKLPMLAAEERFLHACYHAALGNVPPRLVPLRDVAQLLLATDLDGARVMALVDAWSAQAVVARAITLTWSTFGLADALPLSVWAHNYDPTPWERRALRTYLRAERSYGVKALASLRVIHGVPERAAFLRALLFPERSTVARYERSYGRWWRRGARSLLSRRPG